MQPFFNGPCAGVTPSEQQPNGKYSQVSKRKASCLGQLLFFKSLAGVMPSGQQPNFASEQLRMAKPIKNLHHDTKVHTSEL
jgi:hypothetical protein